MDLDYPAVELDLQSQKNWFVNILWYLLYTVTVSFAFGGNVIVVWTVFANRGMRTSTNYLLAGMAISDTLYTLIRAPPIAYVATMDSGYPFGMVYCGIQEIVLSFTMIVTPVILLALALVQYRIIAYPYRTQYKIDQALKCLLIIGIVGLLSSLPSALITKYETVGDRIFCYRSFYFAYDTVITVLIFFGTAIGLICIYGIIIKRMRTDVAQDVMKRQMVIINIVAAVIFLIGWLSVPCLAIYEIFADLFFWTEDLYLFINWLTYCSTMLKPIVYVWISQEFRSHVNNTFPWLHLR